MDCSKKIKEIIDVPERMSDENTKVVDEYVKIILFSDNVGKGLYNTEFNEFLANYLNNHREVLNLQRRYNEQYDRIEEIEL